MKSRRSTRGAAGLKRPSVSRDLAQKMSEIGDGALIVALNNFNNWLQCEKMMTTDDQVGAPCVCCDLQRRTCIVVSRDVDEVQYIPLNIETGLELHSDAPDDFERKYSTMTKYPVDRAARLYVSYATAVGASNEALKILSKLTSITTKEYDMARAKKVNGAGSTAPKKATTKAAPKKATTKAAPKKATTKAAPKAAVNGSGTGRISAASMFKELILDGKLTDNQIFAKVQDKFGLDEKKRGYVAWYRNFLRKQGVKVPEPRD